MGDDERVPSTRQMSTLLYSLDAALVVWRDVPATLQSVHDQMILLAALSAFEHIDKDEGNLQVRGWPAAVGVAFKHLRELSRELAARWGLMPVRQWRPEVRGLDGGPMPGPPFTARDDEIAMLSNFREVLAAAFEWAAEQPGGRPNLRLLKPSDSPPADAIACTQDQVARVLGQSARGGLVDRLEEQGVLNKWRPGGRLYVIFRDPALQQELRKEVEKPKKSRRPPRGRGRKWKNLE
jgi:hypothetical protein